ncbi:MAG: translation initiation factor IF-2 [Planctomycetes bacterium]|nr:translation initiation factor IF-2 [Planctomycetota bacterium]
MSKIRISALAKELSVKSNLLIEQCQAQGFTHITHHANTLSKEEAEKIKEIFGVKKTHPSPPPQVVTPVHTLEETGVKEPHRAIHLRGKTQIFFPDKLVQVPKRPIYKKKINKIVEVEKRRLGAEGVTYPRWRRVPKWRPREVIKPKKLIVKEKKEKISLTSPVIVKDLSNGLGIKANAIITKLLLEHNITATINQVLDDDMVQMLGLEYGVEIELKKAKDIAEDLLLEKTTGKAEDIVPRAPIVTFMGHVDHGKTSLLDSIRQTNVAGGEVGGITQHIGAYSVETNGKAVVFLDTPGHEAFTAMRARGSHITDVVVLVVATDDGVMPQTEEAINHAKAANVPIIVALNKIDKPEANPLRVKQQLANLGLVPEEWGGKTQFVETSAITKKGLDDLLDRILLEAEIIELKANPKILARGVVLEAQLHEGRGVVATVLVRDGILRQGDIILCGGTYGRVRIMYNDRGKEVKEAGPSTPVAVSGFSSVPEAGEKFYVVTDIQKAREIALDMQDKRRKTALAERRHITLENLYSKIEEGKIKEITIILKADVKGSVEVLCKLLEELSTEEVKVRILHSGVGAVTESDVLLADASDAIVIGFSIRPEDRARSLAEEKGVEIRLYQIVYDVTNDIRAAIEGMLEPEKREEILGRVEIRQVYKISKYGNVAGCHVISGKITRNCSIRIIRDNIPIYDGKLASLRIVKDDVKEVRAGYDCGIKIAGYDDIKVSDIIEAYEIQKVARVLV